MKNEIIIDQFSVENILIFKNENEYTTMAKDDYDQMVAQQEHLTENPTEDVE